MLVPWMGGFHFFLGGGVYSVGGRERFVFFCGSEELSFMMGFLRAPNL